MNAVNGASTWWKEMRLPTFASLEDASVSAITSMHLVEHLPHDVMIRLIDEAHRVLRPGGVLVLETPNPENITVRFMLVLYGSDPSKSDSTARCLNGLLSNRGFDAVEVHRLDKNRATSGITRGPTTCPGAADSIACSAYFNAAPDYRRDRTEGMSGWMATSTLYLTGASGFVGKHVLAEAQRGVFGDTAVTAASAGLDLRDAAAAVLADNRRPSPRYRGASCRTEFCSGIVRPPARSIDTNLIGTLNLLEALKSTGFRGRMLYVSSGDVYGAVLESRPARCGNAATNAAESIRVLARSLPNCCASSISFQSTSRSSWHGRSTISVRGRMCVLSSRPSHARWPDRDWPGAGRDPRRRY